MGRHRNGPRSCGGHKLLLLLGLQLVLLVFLLGALVESEALYVWWDRSTLLQGSPHDLRSAVKEGTRVDLELLEKRGVLLPPQNALSKRLLERNAQPPRNQDLYPALAEDNQVKVVLYVHNRPEYLRLVVAGLAEVEGIAETLLIVSHDGFYEEINSIVEGIRFCQVKRILCPVVTPFVSRIPSPGLGIAR